MDAKELTTIEAAEKHMAEHVSAMREIAMSASANRDFWAEVVKKKYPAADGEKAIAFVCMVHNILLAVAEEVEDGDIAEALFVPFPTSTPH